MARLRKGAYAPLAALYYLDDAILEAGPHAELMWVRILSFLASVPSDGYLTDRQLKMVGIGLRDWNQRVVRLREVGLLIVRDGGYEARNWHKWNRSAAEVNRELAKDRDRKARDSRQKAHNSGRNVAAFQEESGSSTEQSRAEQNRELNASFESAYSHWPKKVERKASLEQFKRAAQRMPVADLVEVVSRFGDAYAATTERKFVPALDVWLRKERWTDELPAPSGPPAKRKIAPQDEWKFR